MARDGFSHGRFLVEHVIRPMINLYKITPLAVGDTPAGGPIAYADEQETQELFNARSIFDIGSARYDVIDGQGAPIGVMEDSFGKSLCRSTCKLINPRGAR
jgi:hypothetical protein